MDTITNIAADRGISVVEDNAHGLFARYKGRHLGTLGCLGTQSFHETKNIICGEGGALVINDAGFAERAEIIRGEGERTAGAFFVGKWTSIPGWTSGSSYLPSGSARMHSCALKSKNTRRSTASPWTNLAPVYAEQLKTWAEQGGVRLPVIPGGMRTVLSHVLPDSADA